MRLRGKRSIFLQAEKMLPALLRHRVVSVHSRRLSQLVEGFRHFSSQLVGMNECLARFVEFTQLESSFPETIECFGAPWLHLSF